MRKADIRARMGTGSRRSQNEGINQNGVSRDKFGEERLAHRDAGDGVLGLRDGSYLRGKGSSVVEATCPWSMGYSLEGTKHGHRGLGAMRQGAGKEILMAPLHREDRTSRQVRRTAQRACGRCRAEAGLSSAAAAGPAPCRPEASSALA